MAFKPAGGALRGRSDEVISARLLNGVPVRKQGA